MITKNLQELFSKYHDAFGCVVSIYTYFELSVTGQMHINLEATRNRMSVDDYTYQIASGIFNIVSDRFIIANKYCPKNILIPINKMYNTLNISVIRTMLDGSEILNAPYKFELQRWYDHHKKEFDIEEIYNYLKMNEALK